jgi:regulator of protease activity HflC (stomatin/prohibitin superfamily)
MQKDEVAKKLEIYKLYSQLYQTQGKLMITKFIKNYVKSIVAGLLVILTIFIFTLAPLLIENLDSTEIMVIQSPVAGELTVHIEPGLKWQGFGKVTKYPRQEQYSFCTKMVDKVERNCDENTDAPAKKVRFNDGGHANLSGFIMWEMPLDEKSVVQIHKNFGSVEAVQTRAIAKMIDGAVYLAGPLMSSTESSGSRRAELVQYINDQAERGVYVTTTDQVTVLDPITNTNKTDSITKIKMGPKGPERQQGSVLQEFNINLQPMSITELKYDNVVESQIAERQKATTQVQIAVANARRAEQDALTAAKEGEAKAAKAKWEQEVIKAQQVTQAQQKLEVATLAAKEAEQYKREQILRGEGDSQAKALRMNADGALDAKLAAYVQVNGFYANAIQTAHPGAWTPTVVMGANGGSGGGAQALVDMFTAKTAKELGIDMSVAGKAATGKK